LAFELELRSTTMAHDANATPTAIVIHNASNTPPTRKINWYTLPQAVGTEVYVSMRGPDSHVIPRQQHRQNSHLPCRDCCHARNVEQRRRLKARCLRSFFRLDFSLIDSEEAAAELTFFYGSRSAAASFLNLTNISIADLEVRLGSRKYSGAPG